MLNIVIPLAGIGSRMGALTEHYGSKSMIPFQGKKILEWAISSIPPWLSSQPSVKLHFITRSDLLGHHALNIWIKENFSEATLHTLNSATRGPVDTIYQGLVSEADKYTDLDTLLVLDGDVVVDANNFFQFILTTFNPAILTFNANSANYSYAQLSESGHATFIREKKVISNNAVAGVYYLGRLKLFLQRAKLLLQESTSTELYISEILSRYITLDGPIKTFQTTQHFSLGTLDELLALNQRNISLTFDKIF